MSCLDFSPTPEFSSDMDVKVPEFESKELPVPSFVMGARLPALADGD